MASNTFLLIPNDKSINFPLYGYVIFEPSKVIKYTSSPYSSNKDDKLAAVLSAPPPLSLLLTILF